MPDAGFICGYTIEVVGPHPIDFASRLATAHGLWGAKLRRTMLDYNYYSGIGIVGEILPQQKNLVELHDTERDQYGLPVPTSFSATTRTIGRSSSTQSQR